MYSSTKITGKKAKKLVEKGAILLDARSPVAFRDGTLPGAVNISTRQISMLGKYPKTTKLVFFGDDQQSVSTMLNYAFNMGFTDAFTFGNIDEWDK